jgi:hypothetical protein
MRYREISKEMSSLYFGLDVFCQFESKVPEFDAVLGVLYTLQSTTDEGGGGVACFLELKPQIGRIHQAIQQ